MAGELGYDTGPFVSLAVFCENVINDADGVLTLVRLVDTVTVSAQGEDAPSDIPPGTVLNLNVVVGIKAGNAKGRQQVQVTFEHPDGTRKPGPQVPVHFSGAPNAGQNIHLQVALALTDAGLYIADVTVNDRVVTRMPLDVRYQVLPPGMTV